MLLTWTVLRDFFYLYSKNSFEKIFFIRRWKKSANVCKIYCYSFLCHAKIIFIFCSSSCGFHVAADNIVKCPNLKCSTATEQTDLVAIEAYDVRISISDHTATVAQCRMSDWAAQDLFQMKVCWKHYTLFFVKFKFREGDPYCFYLGNIFSVKHFFVQTLLTWKSWVKF